MDEIARKANSLKTPSGIAFKSCMKMVLLQHRSLYLMLRHLVSKPVSLFLSAQVNIKQSGKRPFLSRSMAMRRHRNPAPCCKYWLYFKVRIKYLPHKFFISNLYSTYPYTILKHCGSWKRLSRKHSCRFKQDSSIINIFTLFCFLRDHLLKRPLFRFCFWFLVFRRIGWNFF